MKGQAGFFDVEDRLKRLSDLGDQLEAYGRLVDFEAFRPALQAAVGYGDGAKGGRPPFDPVMMSKILVIQTQNNLGDDRTEFLINDRLSFMPFLGLGLGDKVPDAKTIWLFRERLVKAGAIEGLFKQFDTLIRDAGYIAMSGQLIDATVVAAPKQRNTQEEKADLKKVLFLLPGKPSQPRFGRRTGMRGGRSNIPRPGSARTVPSLPLIWLFRLLVTKTTSARIDGLA